MGPRYGCSFSFLEHRSNVGSRTRTDARIHILHCENLSNASQSTSSACSLSRLSTNQIQVLRGDSNLTLRRTDQISTNRCVQNLQSCAPSILQVLVGHTYSMLKVSYKGLSSGFLGLAGIGMSRCGMFRSFSSCFARAARRSPTEIELSKMSARRRWYYRKMEDPAFREQESASRRLKVLENHTKMLALPESPERAQYLATRRVTYRRFHHKMRESRSMREWLHRLPDDQREAFDWKTHRPMMYPERVQKTCSTCLASYMHGSRLW